jgi:thiosulfate/3-mercaptopyruvate sulfurtransferase
MQDNSLELDRLLAPQHFSSMLQAQSLPKHVLIAHVDSRQSYEQAHVPGAIWVDPSALLCGVPPARGKIPSEEDLSILFSAIGLEEHTHVVAYDNEGGGWAGRLIWTLEVLGHVRWSYLDGGLSAWRGYGMATESSVNQPKPGNYQARIHPEPIAEWQDVLEASRDAAKVIWDARSAEEYSGEVVYARRGGHVPGAVHYEWLRLMDKHRHLQLRSLEEIGTELAALGIAGHTEVITHCQSHHRSALCYLVGRLLGMRIRGYHGSWGEWGNRDDSPVESGSKP